MNEQRGQLTAYMIYLQCPLQSLNIRGCRNLLERSRIMEKKLSPQFTFKFKVKFLQHLEIFSCKQCKFYFPNRSKRRNHGRRLMLSESTESLPTMSGLCLGIQMVPKRRETRNEWSHFKIGSRARGHLWMGCHQILVVISDLLRLQEIRSHLVWVTSPLY